MPSKPNIVLIMTDQQRADLCRREGFPLDTTPLLDRLAAEGAWFNRAYTTSPTCLPARVSLLTGRFPSATRARTNHNGEDAACAADLLNVLKAHGYAVGRCGKDHSHVAAGRWDYAVGFGHAGGSGEGRTDQEKAFDRYLHDLHHRTDPAAAPFPVECQGPYRMVTAAQKWVDSLPADQAFFCWLTFPEPHNPFQVCQPYFSMFPPEKLPPTRAHLADLPKKGFKFQFTHDIGVEAVPDYDELLPRTRANYCGMLRLIDDQVGRFVAFLDARGLRRSTILLFVSDHGDFVGEYGLVRKGPEMPECLMRIPMIWQGPCIAASESPRADHVCLADVMPTLCEAIGAAIPDGVQGRSLWPMLTGADYPREEFASVYAEQGFGGLHYTAADAARGDLAPIRGDAIIPGCTFDCLNSRSQSGTMRMCRKGDWKLLFDMMGRGQLYNLADDPAELTDLYGGAAVAGVQMEMLQELLAWCLRAEDPLPRPRRRYVAKTDPRNYYAPYRGAG